MRIPLREPRAGVARGLRRSFRLTFFLLLTAALGAGLTSGAQGAPAAANGRILVSSGPRHARGLSGIDPRGGRRLELIPYGGDITGVYSPDGTRIAFASNYDGDLDIYVMNGDGTSIRQLTKNSWADSYPSWSPDGTKLAFTSNRDGDFDIYTMSADGSNQVNLTGEWSQFPDDDPHWSPDGSRIAFAMEHYGSWDVWEFRLESKWLVPLADGWAHEWFDSWSPDGKHFLIDSDQSGDVDLYVIETPPLDAMWYVPQPKVLADDNASQGAAVWSPDGTQIAFSGNRDGDWEVYLMNADGSAQRQLTHNTVDDIVADWQPLYDLRAPTIRALASRDKHGARVRLRYRTWDDSGRTSILILVYAGSRPIGYVATEQHRRAAGHVYSGSWRAPKDFSGALKFCARAYDASGNESKRSCAPIRLG
jgi:Tol biopolymer transport system component